MPALPRLVALVDENGQECDDEDRPAPWRLTDGPLTITPVG